jgi:hypothetical protein
MSSRVNLKKYENPTPFSRTEILGRLRVVQAGELTKLERKLLEEVRHLRARLP